MVKKIFIFLFVFVFAFAGEVNKDTLLKSVSSLISEESFEKNKKFINIIFSPYEDFFVHYRVDIIKVVNVLKENGLLELFFDKPKEVVLEFKSNTTPIFFVKVLNDALRDIGYYRFITKEASLNNSEFRWSISFVSEYATDPVILENELKKSSASIIDVKRKTPTNWQYTIDMSNAHLNVKKLQVRDDFKVRSSLYPYWFDASNVKSIRILSSRNNSWYPYITYFDKNLHLIKVDKIDKKKYDATLKLPKTTKYIKISDIYTMKNIRGYLLIKPRGIR